MIPSKYQQAVYENIENGTGNIVVEAVAGSGKTTTIVNALGYLPKVKSNLGVMVPPRAAFLAFNTHIARELEKRVPPNVDASTLNSLGWKICRANVKGVKLDQYKSENILRTMLPTNNDDTRKLFYKVKGGVSRMVSLLKATEQTPKTVDFVQLADKFDIEIPETKPSDNFDFFEAVTFVFWESVSNTRMMDFDDQIHAPIYNEWTFPIYDWVFGDEAQDWSPVQISFVRRLGVAGRVVAVGDRHQSIYGFRGADPDAIPNIISGLDATVLPLSICYRCPGKVIELAQEVVPHIEAPEGVKEGVVEYIDTPKFVQTVRDGDYVLCRTTAPLVKRCLQLIRNGQKATVKGKDIGKNLVTLLCSLAPSEHTPVSNFLETLAQYRAEQLLKLTKAGREQEASNVEDRCDTLEVLGLACTTTGGIAARIEEIFSDNAVGGVQFSSIHRSKGLEANRIFILRPDLCPHPKSTKPWQIVQEDNLWYVGVTRSMAELYIVTKENDER